MNTNTAEFRDWFERNVPADLTIGPAELVYLPEQSDLAHDLAQLDAICAKPAPEYRPDFEQAIQRATAQQRVQTLNHRPPPQGRTIPLSTVVFIVTCLAFGAFVALLELVGRSM